METYYIYLKNLYIEKPQRICQFCKYSYTPTQIKHNYETFTSGQHPIICQKLEEININTLRSSVVDLTYEPSRNDKYFHPPNCPIVFKKRILIEKIKTSYFGK